MLHSYEEKQKFNSINEKLYMYEGHNLYLINKYLINLPWLDF